jgi:VIT1/CCC1 family predicted Fe2+/Mn2+ transporter
MRIPRLLDPIDRVSEVIFGLIMVLTFTGTLSVSEADRLEVRAMVVSALGCNIAWGIVDAMMYLLAVLTERSHGRNRHDGGHAGRGLTGTDWLRAAAVFLLVFCSTFPVVLPFVLMTDVGRALRVSNAIALTMLFVGGYVLGRSASWRPWRTGAAMAAVGSVLVSITIALGG